MTPLAYLGFGESASGEIGYFRLLRLWPLVVCVAFISSPEPAAGQGQPSGPPAVLVQPAELKDVIAQRDFLGRVQAAEKVNLRARVEGFLENRLFQEGGFVNQGAILFQIDKAPFQADIAQRQADLAAARAVLKNAEVQLARSQELINKQAVAQATLDQRAAEESKARAEVMKAEAALQLAQINLSWTEIAAPFSGRIGSSKFSLGDVVGPTAGPLATLVSTDPINVTFPVTQRELLRARGQREMAQYKVRLILADKSLYAEPGVLELMDVQANQGTDSVTLRARVPNPNSVLIDGMSVSVRLELGDAKKMLVIPFTAVAIDQQGSFVMTVGPENMVARRNVKLGAQMGGLTVVESGLEAGDRVIVEGQQRARPGAVVAPTLWSANAKP